jgi:hypothetical protein
VACIASQKHIKKIAQLDPSGSSFGMLLGSFSMEVVEVIIVVVGAARVVGAGVDVDAEVDMLELGPIT